MGKSVPKRVSVDFANLLEETAAKTGISETVLTKLIAVNYKTGQSSIVVEGNRKVLKARLVKKASVEVDPFDFF